VSSIYVVISIEKSLD